MFGIVLPANQIP